MSSNARSDGLAHHPDLPVPVDIRAMRTARRLRLRYDDQRHVLKLTCPVRTSRRAALSWAATHRSWVEAQIAAALPSRPFVPGARIPFDGADISLEWDAAAPRTPRLEEQRLVCGGPREGFAARVERFLKSRARDTLSLETAAIAQVLGDAATRWGSCTADRRIRYSWRLILAPPQARRYVVAHEVAHLKHLNHGPQFKALERQLFGGDPAPARALLRSVGPAIRRIGRTD
jgi:predicted metal-dependent hydrolase